MTYKYIIMIPKIIYMCHKTLIYIEKYSINWKILNPEYEIKLYDNKMCEIFFQKKFGKIFLEIFKFIKDGPIKADFWRICVLYKYGGVYVDADIEPLVSLNNYINYSVDFMTCFSVNHDNMNPHIIMANKKDILLKKCIDKYIRMYKNKKKYSYWKWSITFIFHKFLLKEKFYERSKNGIYTINNRLYQFLSENLSRNLDYKPFLSLLFLCIF